MPYDLTEDERIKVNEAHAAIMACFNRYSRILKIADAKMQPGLLLCAVASWIIDESRHMEFHPCSDIKRYKRASYFAYWFVWVKPIQVFSEDLQLSREKAIINERFAAFYVYWMLEISKAHIIPKEFNDEMLYVLRYRTSSPESLFATMSLLETSAKSGELWKAYN
jgi:hypothetical protein